MNDKTVIPCEQCGRSLRVPTDRGSIKVQCPHCQAIFIFPPVILTPDMMVTEKKCLKCGYLRHPDDDELSFAGLTKCPMCLASYELVEKALLEEEMKKEKRKWEEERQKTIKKIKKERESSKQEYIQEERKRQREAERQAAEAQAVEAAEKFKAMCESIHEGLMKIGSWFKNKTIDTTMNIAVKTAVKKSLLDITDRLNLFPHLTIKEKVEMFVTLAGMSNELPPFVHWEGTFSLLVIGQTRGQLTTLSNFNDYMPIILELTSDWINRVLGGKSENMYAEIIRLGSASPPSVSEARKVNRDFRTS